MRHRLDSMLDRRVDHSWHPHSPWSILDGISVALAVGPKSPHCRLRGSSQKAPGLLCAVSFRHHDQLKVWTRKKGNTRKVNDSLTKPRGVTLNATDTLQLPLNSVGQQKAQPKAVLVAHAHFWEQCAVHSLCSVCAHRHRRPRNGELTVRGTAWEVCPRDRPG